MVRPLAKRRMQTLDLGSGTRENETMTTLGSGSVVGSPCPRNPSCAHRVQLVDVEPSPLSAVPRNRSTTCAASVLVRGEVRSVGCHVAGEDLNRAFPKVEVLDRGENIGAETSSVEVAGASPA